MRGSQPDSRAGRSARPFVGTATLWRFREKRRSPSPRAGSSPAGWRCRRLPSVRLRVGQRDGFTPRFQLDSISSSGSCSTHLLWIVLGEFVLRHAQNGPVVAEDDRSELVVPLIECQNRLGWSHRPSLADPTSMSDARADKGPVSCRSAYNSSRWNGMNAIQRGLGRSLSRRVLVSTALAGPPYSMQGYAVRLLDAGYTWRRLC